MHLPDINFWIALTFQSHAHHAAAKRWMDAAANKSCGMCRVTQMGLLRLATNRKIFPNAAIPMRDAWRVYDEIPSDERVVFAGEPPEIETAWGACSQLRTFSTNVWGDAYLAAFAVSDSLLEQPMRHSSRACPNHH